MKKTAVGAIFGTRSTRFGGGSWFAKIVTPPVITAELTISGNFDARMCTTSSRTVPVRLGREPVRLQLERWNRLLAADLPVRDPVRAVDGLLRVHPQPGARGVRPGASTEEAVEHEITTTAGVVTSAAIVMVGVS